MLILLALSALLVVPSLAASASDWQSRSIYQVVTDRFATPDNSSPTCNTGDRKYCGGGYKGIINKLDYIQNMGFDAVWISPIVANFNGTSAYGEAYHGYWPQDIYALNTNFGSSDDLKSLASALHQRGMYLMIDVVVNHLAATSFPPSFSSFVPLNQQSDFHTQCWIVDYSNQTEVEQCWLGDTNVALVDVNTEDQNIVGMLNSWVEGIVGNYSADGIRIDTVKHIRKDFWSNFSSSAGVYAIGEVLNNVTSYVSDYTQVLDAVLDYPTWYPLVAGFQTQYGNLSALAEQIKTSQSTYKNGLFGTGSFLENHDQPRFQSLTTDTGRVKNAMAFPFIHDGIPILYYGQEQGYTGGGDPDNREALWLSGYVENKDLVNHVKALNLARKAAISANSKFLSTPMTFPSALESTMAVSKPPMLALFTNVGSNGSTSWTVSNTGYQANTQLTEVLTCKNVTTDSSGGLSTTASNGLPQFYIPSSAVANNSGLCGNSYVAPKHSGSSTNTKVSYVLLGAIAVVGFVLRDIL